MRSSRRAWAVKATWFQERPTDRHEPGSGAPVYEQVRVQGGRPGAGPVVEPGGKAWDNGPGERDDPAVDGQLTVVDVGELEGTDLPGS